MKQKTYSKRYLLWLLLIPLFLMIIIALAPLFLSSNFGKKILISTLNGSLPGSLSIEKLSLSWMGDQEIEGLNYRANDVNISCESISSTAHLFDFLWKPYFVGETKITKPILKIDPSHVYPMQKTQELHAASFLSPNLYTKKLKVDVFSFTGKAEIIEGAITLLSSSSPSITFENINALLTLKEELSEGSLSIKAKTTANHIEGELVLDSHLQMQDNVRLSLEALLNHFPVEGADQLLLLFLPNYSGFAKELLGSQLNMICAATIEPSFSKVILDIASDNLKAFLEMNAQENNLELTSEASLSVTLPKTDTLPSIPLLVKINRLTLPIEENGPVLEDLRIKGTFSSSPYFAKQDIKAQIQGEFSSEKLKDELINTTRITFGNSTILVESSLKDPLNSHADIQSSIDIKKFPTDLVPSLSFLGSWLSGTISLKGPMNRCTGSISLQTPLLDMPTSLFHIQNGGLTLVEPSIMTYRIDPSILGDLFSGQTVLLKDPSTLTINISKLSLKDLLKKETLALDADIRLGSLYFTKLFLLQNYSIEPLVATLKIKNLSDLSLIMKNPSLYFESEWSLKEKEQVLVLKKPLKVEYLLKDEDLKSLSLKGSFPHLLKESQINLTINPTNIPLNNAFHDFEVASTIYIDLLSLVDAKQKKIDLQNTQINASFSKRKDTLSLATTSTLVSPSTSNGKITCQAVFEKISLINDLSVKATVTTENFPIYFIDDFMPIKVQLLPLIGESLTSNLQIVKAEDKVSVKIEAATSLLSLKGDLSFDGKTTTLTKGAGPFLVEYELTERGYSIISPLIFKEKVPSFHLIDKSLFKGSISELSLTDSPDLAHIFIKVSLNNSRATFQRNDSEETISLKNSTISCQKTGQAKTISCVLNTSTEPQGDFHLEAELGQSDTSFKVKGSTIPSSFLDIFAPTKKDFFSTLLGPSFDLDTDLSMQNKSGPFNLDLSSSMTTIHCKGEIVSGTLLLKENAKIQTSLTNKTSQLFLEKNNPSFKSIRAAAPLSLEIGARGFSCPITPLSLNRIEAPSIQLKLGKVFCQSTDKLNKNLKLLKFKQDKEKDIELWFAPADIHISKGIMDIERTEILILGAYDCALWGMVDLPQSFVNMTFALTASTLNKALGLKNLPKDYVLKIPVKGPLNNVEVNSGIATSKIAALMLWSNQAIEKSLGPWGGILKQVIPPPGGEGKTPPPKKPFPWE